MKWSELKRAARKRALEDLRDRFGGTDGSMNRRARRREAFGKDRAEMLADGRRATGQNRVRPMSKRKAEDESAVTAEQRIAAGE